jgi:cyclopropane fatty-acyl-phospholipid synthase-like methyltransferase
MSIGKVFRRILGKRLFNSVGKFYRAFFFDLKIFIDTFPNVKPGSVLLDIGGGDGEPINYVLKKYPDTNVVMMDLADKVGGFLQENYIDKVNIFVKTSVEEYGKLNGPIPDYILIMDVLHHIKKDERKKFLEDIKSVINKNKCQIIVKDNEPGYLKTRLGYWSDVYISGDKNTNLISKDELVKLMESIFDDIKFYETDLFKLNKPNYSFVFLVNH